MAIPLLQVTTIATDPSWWEVLNLFLMTAATLAVAAFGAIELRRQRIEAQSRQKGVDALASAQAYLLRREILSWQELLGTDNMAANTWLANRHSGGRIPEFDRVKERNQALLALASQSSPHVGSAIRASAVHFLEGLDRFERHASSPRPEGADLFVWLQLLDDGAQDLKDAIQSLENTVIEPELLNAEGVSRRTRAASDPFQQFADALLEHERQQSVEDRQGTIPTTPEPLE